MSFRAGAIFADWLFYGRAGAGAEYSRSVVTVDATGVVNCVGAIQNDVPNKTGGFDQFVTGCTSVQRGVVTRTVTNGVAPIVTMAAGIERNFGNIFVRGEVEFIAHFPALTASQIYYSPAINFAAGYRF
jgi:hypothetical protein